MNDFDPGPGWREIHPAAGFPTPEQWEGEVVHFAVKTEHRYWVREEPVPPLPTTPYTVIWVNWRDGSKPQKYALIDGKWGVMTAEELAPQVHSFAILAEPRAVTAKALMLRLETLKEGDDDNWREQILREFGVES